MRTGNYNPFGETWTWGDVDMTATVDVTVEAAIKFATPPSGWSYKVA